ncbi:MULTISPECIES: uracil-xanthine permease family protein [Haloferax]|uniref:Nucleobase:cation symporter-2 family protein n=2 Tax=Haloferax TaxID=2251 RepID=A0ACD5I3T9_9EURY|nr:MULTISPECIES: nucleobase:cation symporter-2 family protein [Haloferax]MBC9988155.1 purine permease [Haloferax sp. AS1]RDZ30784.1 uracil permease [Haloferax sp. Atlit-48N]RDZ34305.1 uracil permease [Haloferax sp. Atlit-24N]RDZ38529.1 uracil permease [Haloferax sp. Atlit-47N]RLM35992.1 purine permease [Haloferax sp. Atlit-109R]
MTSTSADAESDSVVLYDIEDRPPLGEAVPLGIQHVLAMFLGNVAPPLILAGAVGSVSGQTTFLVQMALIVAGAATLVQAFPIGPVGARLPIVMGTSFAFLGPLIGIGQQFGIAAVFGASLLAAPVELVMGVTLDRFQKYFPPLVTGIVVMLIGLTLIPTGMNYAAGASAGPSAAGYGSFANLGLAGLVLVVTVVLNQFFDGFLRVISVFVGIVVGYVAAIALGMVDFTAVATAGWITVPTPLRFGLEFPPSAVLTVAFLYVITGLETIGDISGTVSATGRNPTRKEFRGGLVADAVMSAFAALFNALPNTSFSQNVGLVSFTGVASRYVVGIGGVVLVVLGFVPKVGAVVSVMPDAVLGGGALILFAMIFSSGARIITQNVTLDHRNSTILALSMAFGLGVAFRPEVLQNFPAEVQTLFGSALVTGGFTALALNVVLPGGGVGLGPTEHTDGLDPEDLTELSSSESSPSAPVDD